MSKYVILGTGLQGPAVAYALSVMKPTAEIWLVEKDTPRLDRAKWLLQKKLETENIIFMKVEENTPVLESFRQVADLTVISTLPYTMNYGIATQCIDRNWRYFDLGGHFQTSQKIAAYAIEHHSQEPVMTDIGLAPGLVNILGEYAMKQLPQPNAMQMFCGGLPYNPTINELNYGITFSPKGLVNEYFNDCEALVDGKISKVEPMGDYSSLTIRSQEYESFNTSGGAHTTLESARQKGLMYCSYKTVRHFGHCKVMRFLKNDIGMTTEQICALIEEKIERIAQDRILIAIALRNKPGTDFLLDFEIKFDEDFTAMQKATGFSAAAIVIQAESILNKSLLTYEDIEAESLIALLKNNGLLDLEL